MVSDTIIRKADPGDLHLLHSHCSNAYTESFASHWTQGGLEWYLEKSFGLPRLLEDLVTPKINYFIACDGDKPVGFMKLNVSSTLGGGNAEETMEIEKLYCLANHQGKGFGKQMLNTAISLAKEMSRKSMRLEVLDTNYKAIAFYEKAGFKLLLSTRLTLPYFKDELRGLLVMELRLS